MIYDALYGIIPALMWYFARIQIYRNSSITRVPWTTSSSRVTAHAIMTGGASRGEERNLEEADENKLPDKQTLAGSKVTGEHITV